MILLITHTEKSNAIARAYDEAANRWRGCDWPTCIGPTKLDVSGLKPTQTRILANATSGSESIAWDEATAWLTKVARDAAEAQRLAYEAVVSWNTGKLAEAVAKIETAVAIEAKYREPVTWSPLREAISQ